MVLEDTSHLTKNKNTNGADRLRAHLEDIVERGIPGDIYETGIKFGGTSLFMVGVIEAYEMAKGIIPSREYFFLIPSRDLHVHTKTR